jgi:ParB family chromosome partitioning protein
MVLSSKTSKRPRAAGAVVRVSRAKPAATQLLDLDAIRVGPRMRRSNDAIGELAESMQQHGLLQPIVVRKLRQGGFALVAGGRRLEAARTLGWTSVRATVLGDDASTGRILELVENLQRQDLTPHDEAEAFEAVIRERGWSNLELAQAIKRSPAYVSKRLRVFGDPDLRGAVLESGVAVSTAEELLGLATDLRATLLQRAIVEGWDATAARWAVREALSASESLAGSAGRRRRIASREAVNGQTSDGQSSRPPGLTRHIHDFRVELRGVPAWDLTDADRRELRGLYGELALLARAPTAKRARVIPPLPQVASSTTRGPRRTSQRSR